MIRDAGFAASGYQAGIPALDPAETAQCRTALMAVYEKLDASLQKHFINLHAVFAWADRLGRHPRILDAVERVLGPDLMLWKSKAFVKFPGPGHVPWHQDLPHWNLRPEVAVTAWVALSDVTRDNGCVHVIPGSHHGGSRAAQAAADGDVLLSAGLKFEVSEAEAASAAPMPLAPGQMSLHHGMIVHGSGPNRTAAPRIGLALVYIPAYVIQASAPDMHVPLVRGHDHTGFFPPSPWPRGDAAAEYAHAADYFGKLKSGAIPYNVR